MKFSHSLQFNAVPDWSNHYIAYSNLKKQYVAHLEQIGGISGTIKD
jgi:SPX domain protein involved in polyphosphate accumulation